MCIDQSPSASWTGRRICTPSFTKTSGNISIIKTHSTISNAKRNGTSHIGTSLCQIVSITRIIIIIIGCSHSSHKYRRAPWCSLPVCCWSLSRLHWPLARATPQAQAEVCSARRQSSAWTRLDSDSLRCPPPKSRRPNGNQDSHSGYTFARERPDRNQDCPCHNFVLQKALHNAHQWCQEQKMRIGLPHPHHWKCEGTISLPWRMATSL